MTTPRGGKPFALTCLLAIVFSQLGTADSEVVPAGRRRERASRQEPKELPAQDKARRIPRRTARAEETRPEAAPPQPTSPPQRGTLSQPETAPRRQSVPKTATPAPPVQTTVKTDSAIRKVDPLLQLAERAVAKTSQRYLDANHHTPWQIMHGIVALRRDFELTRGNGKVNCIDFISNAPTFRGEHWFQATRHGGRAHPFSVAYAFEGHANQFLALLSMSNLPLDHQFKVARGRVVTMADMIRNAKMTVNEREEITWTLWFLTHYLDVDAEWNNEDGEPWSIEKLVRLQTNATVTNAPCGGTHGLFAIAYARNAFVHKHGRLHGVYYQAERKIQQHIELARSLQNPDGSFSTEFFKGPGQSVDFNERLKSSGHMLEWLMMAVPQRRLNEAWIRRAVASISTDLIHNAAQPAKCGPLYHALNSLIMYRDRVKPRPTPTQEPAQPELAVDPAPNREQAAAKPKTNEPSPLGADDDAVASNVTTAGSEPILPLLAPEPLPRIAVERTRKTPERSVDTASQTETTSKVELQIGPVLPAADNAPPQIAIDPIRPSAR